MKSLITLILLSFAGATAAASSCVTVDGLTLANGASATFYFNNQPSTQIGPNYSCANVARVRTCVNGQLSNTQPECSQYDSGACVDNWMDRLPDSDFKFAHCED